LNSLRYQETDGERHIAGDDVAGLAVPADDRGRLIGCTSGPSDQHGCVAGTVEGWMGVVGEPAVDRDELVPVGITTYFQ